MRICLISALAVAALWASYTDLRTRRISNRLTFGAAGVAFAIRLMLGGPYALLGGVEGWLQAGRSSSCHMCWAGWAPAMSSWWPPLGLFSALNWPGRRCSLELWPAG